MTNRKPFLFQGHNRQWYNFTPINETKTQLYIYDEISFWGINAANFVHDLNQIMTPEIELHLSSPGGDVFEGFAIAEALRNHAAHITIYIDGYAASIASVIMLAGDRIIAAKLAFVMIHNPFAVAMGDATEMRKMADTLDQIRDVIAKEYADKTGKPIKEFKKMMQAETWFNAESALEIGLIDEINEKSAEKIENRFDLSVFKHTPNELLNQSTDTLPPIEPIIDTLDDDATLDPVPESLDASVESEPPEEESSPPFNAAELRNRQLRLREKVF